MSNDAAAALPFHANRLVIAAQWVEKRPMRYTPAGLPVAEGTLAYEGQVLEAGCARSVAVQLRAIAVGPVSQVVWELPLGQRRTFSGFVASARGGKGIVFHIDQVALPALSEEASSGQ